MFLNLRPFCCVGGRITMADYMYDEQSDPDRDSAYGDDYQS